MNPITTKMLEKFNEHFKPAASLSEADELMTTQEIKDKMDEFYQEGEISSNDLFVALEKAGFKYEWIQEEFKWLLKEKS